MIKRQQGFTLVEMMLVAVIISMMVYAGLNYTQQKTQQMRNDRASLQIQQILNAGLAFYVANGAWPNNIACLQGLGSADPACNSSTQYLPNSLTSPWGQSYHVASNTTNSSIAPQLLYVYTAITAQSAAGGAFANAKAIAGTLPLAYTSSSTSTPPDPTSDCTASSLTCHVVASVNIPGQNLNNARAINFAGLYHHGGCVPVPECPVDATGTTMTPQIMVVPVQVSGVNDAGTNNVYPISSFTAYARGGSPLNTAPPNCDNSSAFNTSADCSQEITGPAAKAYWRVCLQVVTEKGDVQTTRTDLWGNNATLMAVTRCAVSDEAAGSTFQVYSN